MNKTTEPAALAEIEPVAWMAWDDAHSRNVFATGEVEKARTIGYNWTPLYSAATVERLVQERNVLEADNKEILREWKEAARTHNSSMDSMYKALAASQAYSQQLREDAERYLWLRDKSVPPHNFYISVPVEFADTKYTAQEVDAAIDAARPKALSLQQDDTALKAWGAKLLREMADKGCEFHMNDVLRRKADELEWKK